jgi:hypothetical protein
MAATMMPSQSPRNAQDLSISALLSPSAPEDSTRVIRTLLHKHIDHALESLPLRHDATDVGLVNYIGDTIVHLQGMLESIAEELVDDEFVIAKTEIGAGRMDTNGGNLGDLMPIRHFSEAYRNLK